MISFRFHVVSITAVFLAIAIGVMIGTFYADDLTDTLRNRIDTVEDRADATRDENGRLEDELDTTREYIGLSAEYAVTDRLTDVPTLVVAARGVDDRAVEGTVALARQAGGETPGIVWLEPKWALESDEDVEALATISGGATSDSPEVLWALAWEAITDELSVTAEGGSSTSPSTLEVLEAAGFVSVDSLDDDTLTIVDLVGSDPRVLAVTGARVAPELAPVIPVAVGATVDAGLPTVVSDVYVIAPEAPPRGVSLTEQLDEGLRNAIVLVDDLDLEPGRVAAVLALDSVVDEAEAGRHYGYGEGADAVLPAWTPP